MPLVQIYIPNVAGALPSRAYYNVGLNGEYRAKIKGITFADQTQAKDNRLIRISSDSFADIKGNLPQSISLCNRHEHNMGNPQGEYGIRLNAVGGNIDITITSSTTYSNAANNSFDFCILTMEVEEIKK